MSALRRRRRGDVGTTNLANLTNEDDEVPVLDAPVSWLAACALLMAGLLSFLVAPWCGFAVLCLAAGAMVWCIRDMDARSAANLRELRANAAAREAAADLRETFEEELERLMMERLHARGMVRTVPAEDHAA